MAQWKNGIMNDFYGFVLRSPPPDVLKDRFFLKSEWDPHFSIPTCKRWVYFSIAYSVSNLIFCEKIF